MRISIKKTLFHTFHTATFLKLLSASQIAEVKKSIFNGIEATIPSGIVMYGNRFSAKISLDMIFYTDVRAGLLHKATIHRAVQGRPFAKSSYHMTRVKYLTRSEHYLKPIIRFVKIHR